MSNCHHQNVTCLNPYELIRKYRCEGCGEVMMCMCEKEHGERFLPHQLKQGSILETQERVPVTLGFQKDICPECRGETPIHAPKASMPGCTSKIARYYWREIQLETTKRFYKQNPNYDPNNYAECEFSFPEQRKTIEKEIIEELKVKHKVSPKYEYNETPQSEVIKETHTEVILVKGEYIATSERKTAVRGKSGAVSVEEFAAEYFDSLGYRSIATESIPFHVLFATYMWMLIQDPADPLNRIVGFGSRTEFDESPESKTPIHTALPSDFGTEGYFERREPKIAKHISELEGLSWLFDYWGPYSSDLREYLWAHREKDINMAKTLVDILPEEDIKKILLYLARNYWANFCGWPDLLVYKENEFMFVEVKSSNDKLSEDQKRWLQGNHKYMGFTVKIFKIGK